MSRRIRLYCQDLREGTVELTGAEAAHALTVLRLTVGQVVELFDGCGRSASACISAAGRDILTVLSDHPAPSDPPPFKIALAAAIPKLSVQQSMVTGAVEVGVDSFWPIIYEHSSVRKIAVPRWKRWAIEACKQCGRNDLPEIIEPITLDQALQRCDESDVKLFGSTAENASQNLHNWDSAVVFVGPEGGFSAAEQQRLLDCGAIPVRLGRFVMRTETAATALTAALIHARQSVID